MGGWSIDRNTSHMETQKRFGQKLGHQAPNVLNRKATQQWDMDKTNIQAARLKMYVRDILPDEVEEFDAKKEAGYSSGTSSAMRYTSTHPHRLDTDAESCSVQRRRWETPQQ